jgi:hypothetical protein|tara:strand:- start:1778 stop:2035 length:258 start_codon:yes stop_codon:yes gene_type:complete
MSPTALIAGFIAFYLFSQQKAAPATPKKDSPPGTTNEVNRTGANPQDPKKTNTENQSRTEKQQNAGDYLSDLQKSATNLFDHLFG